MAKIRISKYELERLALWEIQAARGCEEIYLVEIEYVANGPGRSNWMITTISYETYSPRNALAVIWRTQNKLRQQYDLMIDS
jgi:hypothetical protein